MTRAISYHRPDRLVWWMPARRPEVLTSWQGNPPHRMSTRGAAFQSAAAMSPRFGTPGQWAASTLEAAGSISDCHTVVAPNRSSTARSSIPAPENSDPMVITAQRPAATGRRR